VPGVVHFEAGPEWRAVATGPEVILQHLQFSDGVLEFDQPMSRCGAELKIALTGPEVRRWTLLGSGDLTLEQLNQADLDITVSGSGSATATGKVGQTRAAIKGSGDLNLGGLMQTNFDLAIKGSGSVTAGGAAEHTTISIAGSGDARLGRLLVKDASVRIRGSGNADIAPENSADIEIYGSGNVRLLKQPGTMQTSIHGSGTIIGTRL
jgi:Putative auto-transporter adhesin, head GIN domain